MIEIPYSDLAPWEGIVLFFMQVQPVSDRTMPCIDLVHLHILTLSEPSCGVDAASNERGFLRSTIDACS